jgi:hypothetical protein
VEIKIAGSTLVRESGWHCSSTRREREASSKGSKRSNKNIKDSTERTLIYFQRSVEASAGSPTSANKLRGREEVAMTMGKSRCEVRRVDWYVWLTKIDLGASALRPFA